MVEESSHLVIKAWAKVEESSHLVIKAWTKYTHDWNCIIECMQYFGGRVNSHSYWIMGWVQALWRLKEPYIHGGKGKRNPSREESEFFKEEEERKNKVCC